MATTFLRRAGQLRHFSGSSRARRGGKSSSSALVPEKETWTEVIDKKSGEAYFWNKRTNETTAIGEPKPGSEGRQKQISSDKLVRVVSPGRNLGEMALLGFGMTLAFVLVGAVVGAEPSEPV